MRPIHIDVHNKVHFTKMSQFAQPPVKFLSKELYNIDLGVFHRARYIANGAKLVAVGGSV